MSDDGKCYAATPAATLEEHILNSNIAKSDTEWWAHREITRLRSELAAVTAERDRMREALRPFATAAYSNMGGGLNHLHTICSIITLDDLRRARAIFNRAQEKSGAGNE